jgi:alcohol dehydrogenase class IV
VKIDREPCKLCGAEPRFLMLSRAKTRKAVANATKEAAKRICQLKEELAQALDAEQAPVLKRQNLVDLQSIADRSTQQRLIGWNMAQLTFDDIDRLIEEIEDLRRRRDGRR